MAKCNCIEVAWMPTDQSVRSASLKVPEGTTIETVLSLLSLTPIAWMISCNGRRADVGHVVEAGDHVALCQPLRIDPKQARRRRALKK